MNAKIRNKPFAKWFENFPIGEREKAAERVAAFMKKSVYTIKAYKKFGRSIPAVEAIGIQKATIAISKEDGFKDFVKAKHIFPDLHEAFKQGESTEESHDKEVNTKDTSNNMDAPRAKVCTSADGTDAKRINEQAA